MTLTRVHRIGFRGPTKRGWPRWKRFASPPRIHPLLNKHFQDFLGLLEKHNVEYVIVGGYAVGVHGFPRYTGDMDVFVGTSSENAGRLVDVFNDSPRSKDPIDLEELVRQRDLQRKREIEREIE